MNIETCVTLTDLIKDNFHNGYYAVEDGTKYEVIVHDTGHINASQLCAKHDRVVGDWLNENDELIKIVVEEIAWEDGDGPFMVVENSGITDEDKLIAGLYCCPTFIPIILGWLMPEYGEKFYEYFMNELEKHCVLKANDQLYISQYL